MTAAIIPFPPQAPDDPRHIRRPRLLMQAALRGLALYRRSRDLPPLVGDAPDPWGALVAAEGAADAARRAGHGHYRPRAHLELLIALIAEARDRPPPAGRVNRG